MPWRNIFLCRLQEAVWLFSRLRNEASTLKCTSDDATTAEEVAGAREEATLTLHLPTAKQMAKFWEIIQTISTPALVASVLHHATTTTGSSYYNFLTECPGGGGGGKWLGIRGWVLAIRMSSHASFREREGWTKSQKLCHLRAADTGWRISCSCW